MFFTFHVSPKRKPNLTMKLGFLGFTYNRSETGMRFASENSKQEP